jgi:hypothetical protein
MVDVGVDCWFGEASVNTVPFLFYILPSHIPHRTLLSCTLFEQIPRSLPVTPAISPSELEQISNRWLRVGSEGCSRETISKLQMLARRQ